MKILDVLKAAAGSGWVLVFPRGNHYIHKYDKVLKCDDTFFNSVEKWWKESSFKKPYLDKGHDFDEKYGEFTEYRITDAGLEMFLTLNEAGKELVKSGMYDYLSPTFGDAKDSNGKEFKNVIFTVSLVNYPALLVLDKIQNQIALSFGEGDHNNKGGSEMKELRELVAGKLKLNLAADDASILAKLEELLNAGATIEDLKTEIEKMKSEVQAAKDAAKTAEAGKVKAEEELSALKASAVDDEAKRVIDEAISLGQYHPSLKDMKVEQYKTNKDLVMKELAVLPKTQQTGKQTGNPAVDALNFTEEDKAILLAAGYNLEDPKDLELAKKFVETYGGK